MYSLLQEKAYRYENSLVGFTLRLAAIPASSNFEEELVGEAVASQMYSLGYEKVFLDSFGNVAGCLFGRNYSPTLLLVSRMDTISRAGNFTKITPRIENDCIYGYGASDSGGDHDNAMFT